MGALCMTMQTMKRRGRPPKPREAHVIRPAPLWESPVVAENVQKILDALEVPPIDEAMRSLLQRIWWRKNYFGEDGDGHVVLTLRCILESAGNENALVKPIVYAVSICLTPAVAGRGIELLEAFDQIPLMKILETMRGLDLFREQSLGSYIAIALKNKLAKMLQPIEHSKPAAKIARSPLRSYSQ
jgi:hypothetical protein